MKESLGRIVEWAKNHKLAAGLILGAVILIAFLVYKKSGGAGMAPTAAGEGVPAGYGAGAAVGGGGGSGSGGSVPGSQPPKVNPAPAPGGGGGGGKKKKGSGVPQWGGGNLPPLSGGMENFPIITEQPVFNALPVPGGPGGRAAVGPIVRQQVETYGGSNVVNEHIEKSGANKNMRQGAQTPAMAVGKGRLYTGTYNGIQYMNGYPITQQGNVINAQTGNNPQISHPGAIIRY